MDFIKPIKITDNELISSTIPETDYVEWASGTTYSAGTRVIVTAQGIHKVYESLVGSNLGNYPPTDITSKWLEIGATNRWKAFDGKLGSHTAGTLAPDLLNEDCSDISDWTNADAGTGVSSVDPAGQMKLDSGATATAGTRASRRRTIASPPTQFTVELRVYCVAIDALALDHHSTKGNLRVQYETGTWRFAALFCKPGWNLILKSAWNGYNYVLPSVVKEGASAEWQKWRFEIDKSKGESLATCKVYCDDVLLRNVPYSCADVQAGTNGLISLTQFGESTASRMSHIDYIRVATGLGAIDVAAPNVTYVLAPGAIDSVALLNIQSTSVQISMTSGGSTVYNETITTGISKIDVVKTNLPKHANGILTVTVTDTSGAAKLGELIVGNKTYIGTMRYSPSVGITDYSTKQVDTFGHYSVVPRSFAKKMTCSLIILNSAIDEVIRLLTLYRSTELVWVGDENYNALIIYGFYKDFQMVFARPQSSDCALEIEGLT